MVVELVEMNVKPGLEAAFEVAFGPASELLLRSKGCESVRVMRGIEHASRYRILIQWQKLENHTEDFRGSEDHKKFREIVAPFSERSVPTEHHTVVMDIPHSPS